MKRDAQGRLHLKTVIYGTKNVGKTAIFHSLTETMKEACEVLITQSKSTMFDYAQLRLTKNVLIDLYAPPGGHAFQSIRKMVLTGADIVIFVTSDNINPNDATQSLQELLTNLTQLKIKPYTALTINQFNNNNNNNNDNDTKLQNKYIKPLLSKTNGFMNIKDVYQIQAKQDKKTVLETFKQIIKKGIKK